METGGEILENGKPGKRTFFAVMPFIVPGDENMNGLCSYHRKGTGCICDVAKNFNVDA